MERTLILVKPDAMQRGLAGEILVRLERRGLRIAGLKLLQVDRALAERHYGEHVGKPFYEGLVSYITACPIIAAVLEGTNAVESVRNTVGKTNPKDAAPGTIRGDFGPDYYTPVEGVGIFWHIVDLIWIFLFPLLYLVG